MSSASLIQYPTPALRAQRTTKLTRRLNAEGMPYMPIKLKLVLARIDVRQSAWCARIPQPDGKPLSRAAGSEILNWNTWPRLTRRDDIVRLTEQMLREKGVTDDVIATIWDEDKEDDGRNQRPPSSIYVRPATATHPKAGEPDRLGKQPLTQPEEFHLEPEMLSDQAKKHFRIPRDPFKDDVNDPRDVFLTPDIRYVREAMYQAATHGDVLAVIAEVGAGKSTLRRELQDRFMREEKPVVVIAPKIIDKKRLKADHISDTIIQALDPDATCPNNAERKAAKAERMLCTSMDGGNTHVILIEEGQDLSTRMLKMLKRFSEMEKGMKKLLSIIIVGQSELDRILDLRANPEAREFIHRCGKISLPPLDKHLEDYLAFKLKRVGVDIAEIFEKDVADAVRERLTLRDPRGSRSMLYPLYINNVCTKALNLGASLGVPKVSAQVVRELK